MKKPLTSYASFYAFISYLSRYKLRFAAVFLSFTVANVLLAVVPLFIGKLIGALAAHPVDRHEAIVYTIVLIICSTAHDLVWHCGEFLYLKLFNGPIYNYQNILFHQVIRKPYPYFVNKFTGKISSHIETIGQESRDQLERVFWNYAEHIVSIITICIVLTALNWQTGLVFVACLLLMLVVGRYTVRNSTRYEKIWTDVQSDKNAKIIDAIANFVNIKSFHKEREEYQAIRHEQAKTADAAGRSFIWAIVFWGSMGFIVRNIIWPATIILNVYLYLNHKISLADLTTFLTAVVLFSTYIWEIIWSFSQFTLKLARIEEAYTYLFGKTNAVEDYFAFQEREQAARPFAKQLELHNLSFAYPDQPGEAVLQSINLTIKSGEKIGIVGRSGSGKTTLTKLLLDYYELDPSQLLLDGQPAEPRDIAALISYVPQDTSLFHRTIADNIAYAASHQVDHAAVVRAAKQAHAHEFIEQIPDAYDALVGERGVKLSAGQRQRIAIARAFLDDKPILVLDEATSALDSESEILVQQALEKLWHNKTVIAIAHRLSTLRNMDRIIVMDDGQIIESGSHKALLKQKGHYAKLWSHQSGGFLADDSATEE